MDIADRRKQQIREDCQFEKAKIRKESINLIEDRKIQKILLFQSTVDDKLYEISQKLTVLNKDKENLESDLLETNAEISKAQEAIDAIRRKKRHLFETKKHFKDSQGRLFKVMNASFEEKVDNYKKVEQKYKEVKQQTENLRREYDDLYNRKQNYKYYVFSPSANDVLAKLEGAFSNIQSNDRIGPLPSAVKISVLPSISCDMNSFMWDEEPFSVRIKSKYYIFTCGGILVFDKCGIYEGILLPTSIKCDTTQYPTLYIQIAKDEFSVRVYYFGAAERLKRAIANYQMLRIAFNPCFSIIELLEECSEPGTPIEKMRSAVIINGKHAKCFFVKKPSEEYRKKDESLNNFKIIQRYHSKEEIF